GCFILFFSKTYSRPNDTIKISGSFHESIPDFLNDISKSSYVKIYYQSEWFQANMITKVYKDASMSFVLDDVLYGLPYTYCWIQSNYIVILPKEEVLSVIGRSLYPSNLPDNMVQMIGKLEDIGKVTNPELSGKVIDGKNGEPIVNATILVENISVGGASDNKGDYKLVLTAGVYHLVFSNIGYESKTCTIKLIGNGLMDIELYEQSVKLDEVVVSAQKADKNVRNNQMSMVELDKKAIKQIPSLFGEKDVIKSLTMMPGVNSIGEFGAGINVRGGSSDQNLLLLKGAPLFNSAHVF